LTENYSRLQRSIGQKEKHSLSFWVNLITKTMQEIDQIVINRSGLSVEESLYTFEEFEKWTQTLTKTKVAFALEKTKPDKLTVMMEVKN